MQIGYCGYRVICLSFLYRAFDESQSVRWKLDAYDKTSQSDNALLYDHGLHIMHCTKRQHVC